MFRFTSAVRFLLMLVLVRAATAQDSIPEVGLPQAAANESTLQAREPDPIRGWQAKRFGMFIHWGPVTLKGTEIGWSRGRDVPTAEYDELYLQFNPTAFDADAVFGVAFSTFFPRAFLGLNSV